MRALITASLLLLSAAAFGQPAAAANPLQNAVAQGATSMAWRIQTEGVYICCCNENDSITINHGDRNRIEYDNIILVARMEEGRIARLRMVEPNCPLANTRLIENVSADASLDFLLSHVRNDERVVAGIAMHDHPRVVPELIKLARNHASAKVRQDAIFWLGQRAGEKAAGELRRAVDEDPEDDVRERAVFAISQLPADRSVPILIDLVKHHRRPKVRERAMFWLAQTGDPRALDLIEEILGLR
ncbi:MAG TPA: HEAT repeat domain-containing protein [Thermoanaerobaculia bacterium]|jgi:hypothetical protein|nr:HEAT repeat domain-containing protein [Thermoanaerobaculia bacterium]